jgi:glucose-1-phosphate thymidylyltransferase
MHAVVMAAGEGRRMRPITERYAKPVLPIDGRPAIVTLLHELAGAGITRVSVVIGHLGEQVEGLLEGFPLEVRFVQQPRPDGSADAVRRSLEALPAVVAASDTVFAAGDVARVAGTPGHALAVRRDPPPDPKHRRPMRISDGRVVRVVDDDPGNPLGSAPLWRLGETFDRTILDDLPGPPYELSQAFQRLVDAGEILHAVEIGATRDLTHPQDLIRENFPYLRGMKEL